MIARIDDAAKGWTASPAAMLALLDLVSDIELKGSRLMSYASHQSNTDMGNTRFQAMQGEIRTLFVQMNSKLSFLQPDVLALGAEKFAAYLKAEPKLAVYRFGIESILREKDHVLPGEQQRIASLTGLFAGAPGARLRACSTTWRSRRPRSPSATGRRSSSISPPTSACAPRRTPPTAPWP